MDLLQELELRLHRILYARILQEQVLQLCAVLPLWWIQTSLLSLVRIQCT